MNNKLLTLMLVILLIFTSACTGSGSEQSQDVVTPASKGETPGITIMLSAFEYDQFMIDSALSNYVSKFEKDMGVKVNFEIVKPTVGKPVDNEYQSDYIKKASIKLYPKDGPELIFSDSIFINALIEQGVALDVKGKVQNVSKIYDGIIGDNVYYVPIGVRCWGKSLKKQMFDDLKLEEPDYEITYEEYEKLMDQWIAKMKIDFTRNEFGRLFNKYIFIEGFGDIESKNLEINTPEIAEGIKKLRQEMFSGKYKLVEGYTYQNYYNAFYEIGSPEMKVFEQMQSKGNGVSMEGHISNILRAGTIVNESRKNEVIPMLGFVGGTPYLDTRGFMVNKNGKNLELAYEFINGLLSDEEQMEVFKNSSSSFYPVNKEIEAEIIKIEEDKISDPRAMELKKRALSKLKETGLKIEGQPQEKEQPKIETERANKLDKISSELWKDLAKLILTDNLYKGEALRNELKKLENKYNIWLSE